MIRTTHAHLNVAAATHPGNAGRQNEDRFAVSAYLLSEADPTPSVFAVISDGIGGHRAGEVAAEMAVEWISHRVAQSDPGRPPLEILDEAIRTASEHIVSSARDNAQRLGMGTTCACAWIIGDQLFTASVGNSRIYLLRVDAILQLTVDHTWIQEALDKGLLKPDQVRNHPNLHVIHRYLGSSKAPQADVRLRMEKNESDTQSRSNQGMRLRPGDVILLCTDGLTDMVADGEIQAIVRGDPRPWRGRQNSAQALVDRASALGGSDNITAVLLAVPVDRVPKKKARFRP